MESYGKRDLAEALNKVHPGLGDQLGGDGAHALFEEARRLDVDGVEVVTTTPTFPPGTLGLITVDERWYINVTKLRSDVLWQMIVGFASVIFAQPFLSVAAGVAQIRGLTQKISRLDPDEGDVAATLVRLVAESEAPVARDALEAAYAHDPDRDGAMPDGVRPIDAPAVIDRLIDKGVVVVKADGRLTIQF